MATNMSTGKTFALIFAILLIGPLMFITSRFLSLGQRFEKVSVGDDVAKVKATMGPPSEEASTVLASPRNANRSELASASDRAMRSMINS